MRNWTFGSMVVIALLIHAVLGAHVSRADRNTPIRIGALTGSWGPTPSIVALRDGLVKLGYREETDFVMGIRFTQGDVKAVPTAARELVEYGVDLIVTSENYAAKAAQIATTTIPIVFTVVDDPVGQGIIHSFARPGGNITGVTELAFELGPKRLEVFRDVVTGLRRVLFAYDATDSYAVAEAEIYRDAARRLGIKLVEKAIQMPEAARATITQVQQGEVDGILAPRCCSMNIPGFIMEVSKQQKIPTMFPDAFWVERGALASYGPDFADSGRMAARLVDKILRGAKPAELPVEVNSKIEFAISLPVAKTLGLNFSPEILYRADRVVR